MESLILIIGGVVVLSALLLVILGFIGGLSRLVPLVLAIVLGGLLLYFIFSLGDIQAGGGDPGAISFAEIFEERGNPAQDELKIVHTRELDVDEDSENEWIVLYQYDPYTGNPYAESPEQSWADAPAQAIIYDALPCDPPLIHNWQLPFPDNDYLGEGPQIDAEMRNVLRSNFDAIGLPPDQVATDTINELMIYGTGPNSETLSLWRYHDRNARFPCTPVNPMEQGFDLLGFWRADKILPPVNLSPDGEDAEDESIVPTVTTYRRTAFERSQLAIRSIYQVPTLDTPTFLGSDGRTLPPVEQGVDFAYGTPNLPTDSPYPEKAVATMLLALGSKPSAGDDYLVRFFNETPLNTEQDPDRWKVEVANALGLPLEELSHVLILSIAYEPDREAERLHLPRTVRTRVMPVDINQQRRPVQEITWGVQGFVVDRPEDCEWRIFDTGNITTPGTGSLPPAAPPVAVTHE